MNVLVNVENRSPQEQRAYYNKLFSLYEKLTLPLLELEELDGKLYTEEQQLKKIKEKGLINPIISFIIIYILFGIIFQLICGIASMLHLSESYMKIAVIITLIISISVYILIYTYCKKKKIGKIQQQIDSYKQQIEEHYKTNMDMYQFVPNGYLNSDAIRYFTQCYRVGKASDLKEAMQLYDLYLHQQRMELGQQQILTQQQQIAKNQNSMRKEMAFDTAMLFLSRF